MDTIKSMLFENPTVLYMILAVVELVLVFLWWDRRAERSGRKYLFAMAVPPVLGVALLVASTLVVTDREQIVQAAKEIAADLSRGDGGALEKYLDEKFVVRFEGFPISRGMVLALVESQKKKYAIDDIEIVSSTVNVESDDYATMHVATRMTGRDRDLGANFSGGVKFVVKWIKRPDGWKVLECEEPVVQR